MKKKARLLGLVLGLVAAGEGAALGQTANTVLTQPQIATTSGGNASGSLAASSTFQQVFGANSVRKGCTIQNNGTHSMYVTEGLGVAGSTTAKATVLGVGSTYYCQVSGVVLTGEIDIAGTAGDTFYAAQY